MNEPIKETLTTSSTKARAEIYGRQGDLFQEKGDLNAAITAYINSIKFDSTNQDIWIKFANTIKFVQFSSYNETIKQIITTGLSRAGICHQHFALPAISLLKLAPGYQLESEKNKLLEDKLFVRLLKKTLLPDQEIEKLLTSTRRSLLEIAAKDHFLILPKISLKFLYALSRNCFYNEFVFAEQQSEVIALDQLFSFLNSQETIDLAQFKALAALYGCYRPIQKVPFAAKLIEMAEADPEFSALVEEQVKEPLEEELISAHIPLLKSISDAVSAKVSSQYEENPYPRWKTIDKAKSKSAEQLEILIAGCGTGQHAINTAICYPESHLLAIDLSKKSLAYAARKAKELKISNIEFLQADLLNLEASIDRTFDLIESVGVLHHLEDPVRGWRILTKLLKPQGRMEIGLYSETARQDVASAKVLIKTKGYRATSEDIRQCRQDIFALSATDPIHDLSLGVDFYSLSACRDLLFHVQEQCFTLQQIAIILQELGLRFLGFDIRDHSVLKKYLEQFGGEDPQALSLEHWQQFELDNPHTFIGMYSFSVQKKV